MKTLPKVMLSLAAALIIAFGALAVWAAVISGGVALDESKLINARSDVEIYDGNNELVKEVSIVTRGAGAKIESVPLSVKNAFVAIEDKRFYKHGGIDFKRVISATLKNMKSGSFKEGASTITQQLIKNTHLTGEKTIKRKLQEMRLSRQVEKKYGKDEILEMYLNTIYFGHSCFGIADAAYFYFGKSVDELTLSEGATLAGLVKAPNSYSPFKNKEKCLGRRNLVLKQMQALGYITEDELKLALAEPLPEKENATSGSTYLEEAVAEAESILGKDGFYGGVKIYTYLDGATQEKLENLSDESDSDKAFIIEDNARRGITAFYSSAGNIKRLPGSVIKPLLVYAPALEEGLISPATLINDEPINYGGYSPKNFGGKYGGYISARKALAESVNVPAVKVLNSVGIKRACGYTKKMGLETEEKDMSLALALGGMSEGYTLRQLCSAYSTFARRGEYEHSAFIRKIEDMNGKTLYERKEDATRVFSEETTALINDMLRTAVKEGTAKKLSACPYEICAKTGTCESGGKNTDAYAISYTSRYSVGVWLGNASNEEITTTGGGLPCMINGIICEYLYKNSPPDDLEKCKNVVSVSLDKEEYVKNHNLVLADDNAPTKEKITEIFAKNNIPHVKSERFSSPAFTEEPNIEYKDNTVYIVLCQREYNTYCIKRVDELGREETYYTAGSFTDTAIEENKIYTYTVTPILNKKAGKPLTLPSVYTKNTAEENLDGDEKILNRDWWNE